MATFCKFRLPWVIHSLALGMERRLICLRRDLGITTLTHLKPGYRKRLLLRDALGVRPTLNPASTTSGFELLLPSAPCISTKKAGSGNLLVKTNRPILRVKRQVGVRAQTLDSYVG